MKTNPKSTMVILVVALLMLTENSLLAQTRQSIGVIAIATKDIELDDEAIANLMRLELEKIDRYEVLDKYDVQEIIANNPDAPKNYYGKTAALKAGKMLRANKMLTGSVERYGDKIVFILRLVDVKNELIEKTSVMEFQNIQQEIQAMTMISINELLGIENDKYLVDLLIDYDLPITSLKTTMRLNGPRMGAAYITGETGERMRDSKDEGGFDMFSLSSMFGYQFEKQYLTSGDFQALIEGVVAITGLESGQLIPSITAINGFRFSNNGVEFGLGPNFRLTKLSEGFYENGKWILKSNAETIPEDARIVSRLDSRGTPELSMSLMVIVGKTFRSGYLNIPFNIYAIPRKDGTVIGVTFGFNTSSRPKL